MMDAFSGAVEFARITEAREHDQKFLYHLKLVANSWIVFDKAYTTYGQFSKWARENMVCNSGADKCRLPRHQSVA